MPEPVGQIPCTATQFFLFQPIDKINYIEKSGFTTAFNGLGSGNFQDSCRLKQNRVALLEA